MRVVLFSEEFDRFFESQPVAVQAKLDYAIRAVKELRIISAKLVKKLVDTDFYELRISMSNEYRVIIFAIDHDNIVEATKIILLNGFIKKSTKDYKKQIDIAVKLLNDMEL